MVRIPGIPDTWYPDTATFTGTRHPNWYTCEPLPQECGCEGTCDCVSCEEGVDTSRIPFYCSDGGGLVVCQREYY